MDLLLESPETRSELNDGELDILVDLGCLVYGCTADESRIGQLQKLYRLYVERRPRDVRMTSLLRPAEAVEAGHTAVTPRRSLSL